MILERFYVFSYLGGMDLKDIHIQQIENLMGYEFSHLVQDSEEEGFNFLIRLISEYKNEINTFNKTGECLYGIFQGDMLIGVGGLNEDPYTKDNKIGRLRRFYISKDFRRIGLGNLLLNQLLCHAEKYFEVIVLHADTKEGDAFYTANGFLKEGLYKGSSHYKVLSR
ncbi:GNAT family N-acetyltransferase [Bacillus thuringiensis]|nr:GNAT family N-acetyltransferase [Bacillus thuringiensis]MED2808878.1 GNAT family N-acetyltransferase [Bacillus thuringiensis]MED2827501.1 GNAT family N-acetyltransferase [Bacillus thuringiensis]MED2834313.1 GNAT family N-acetyltransferase [Bacillus thuringiensis]MED2852150.1 GNAT family N-acetyltransferase [Bacillus thuringiensis]